MATENKKQVIPPCPAVLTHSLIIIEKAGIEQQLIGADIGHFDVIVTNEIYPRALLQNVIERTAQKIDESSVKCREDNAPAPTGF